jgi:RNA polymerase sigma factor (sigma-70 family)
MRPNGWEFVVARKFKENPASKSQLLDMYTKIQKIIGYKYKTYSNKEDIVGAAIVGLVNAAQTYDSSRGEWPIYAKTIAQKAAIDFLRREEAGRPQAKAKTELKSIQERFRKEHPDVPDPNLQQLASFSGKTIDEIHKLRSQAARGFSTSLSAGVMGDISDENEATLADTIEDKEYTGPEEQVLVSQVKALRTDLSDEAAYIGAYLLKDKSQAWIAKKLNISVSKVRALSKEFYALRKKPE